MSNLQEHVNRLISSQTASWETARKNYAALRHIQSKTIGFDGFSTTVQFNPERARSTTAPVETGIKRPCFLCAANRPTEQEAVQWTGYEILVNPYPIFDPHLTIPAREHIPQFLTGKIGDMVHLAAELSDFVLTFNGARSGASAPDHFHFQAVGQGTLPAQRELPQWPHRNVLHTTADVSVRAVDHYLRPALIVEGKTAAETAQTAENILSALKEILSEPDEAQLNALAWHDVETYTVVFFPRTAHRPKEFYAADETQFLFSPGAIDLAGTIITVRQTDYQRVSAPLITALFRQVVPDAALWQRVKTELSLCLAKNRK
ncbi:DUF4922 domain-containing protein [Alistipes sp. OttesenSCG-928-L06]|nr:DUF4922 domain-containing protein [Alistipes sp. OttesenSCG-928-L06]